MRPAVFFGLALLAGAAMVQLLPAAGDGPAAGVEVIPLAFHVDYWNYIGWADPFSDAAWSERQRRYAEVMRTGRVVDRGFRASRHCGVVAERTARGRGRGGLGQAKPRRRGLSPGP